MINICITITSQNEQRHYITLHGNYQHHCHNYNLTYKISDDSVSFLCDDFWEDITQSLKEELKEKVDR